MQRATETACHLLPAKCHLPHRKGSGQVTRKESKWNPSAMAYLHTPPASGSIGKQGVWQPFAPFQLASVEWANFAHTNLTCPKGLEIEG